MIQPGLFHPDLYWTQQQFPDRLRPTEESGLLMLSLNVKKMLCRHVAGAGVREMQGAADFEQGHEWMGNLSP
jgi:hypothetical protein